MSSTRSHTLPRSINLLLHFILLFGRILKRKSQNLNVVNLATVEPKDKFWVDHFFVLAEVCHAEIILFVLNIINLTCVRNHPI